MFLHSESDKVRFILWLAEYLLVLMVLVIGLKAPALANPAQEYSNLAEDTEVSGSNVSSKLDVYCGLSCVNV